MNIYITVVVISILVYVFVGLFAGRKVADTSDYYVSGRNANTLLIAGTLYASMVSTNTFMGDLGWVYGGNFANEIVLNSLCGVGFVFGVLFFGRYLRRSGALTMPSFFANRFNDPKMKRYAGITVVVSVTCYILAVTTGVGILLEEMTGWSTTVCYVLAFACFISFTFYSGSKGVILTDTIMFLIFLLASIVAGPYMFSEVGGLSHLFGVLMDKMGELPQGYLDYHGNFIGAGATDAFGSVMYGVIMGVIWFIVVGISPWQAGRNLMARSEHVAMRASVIACICGTVFVAYLYFEAMTVSAVNPTGVEPTETVMIWAAYNLMPKIIGAVVLAGIMAAGLSSASTFLSLVGFSLTNDVLNLKFKDDKDQLRKTRIVMLIVGVIALILALIGFGGIRVVSWFATTIIASSWVVAGFGSIWSKRLTARGARWSMTTGFVVFFTAKALQATGIVTIFYNFLDPFLVAVYCSIIAAIVGSYGQKKTEGEIEQLKQLHTIPKSIRSLKEYKITFVYADILIVAGVFFSVVLLVMWALPYNGII